MTSATIDDEDLTVRCCVPLTSLTSPVDVGQFGCVLSLLPPSSHASACNSNCPSPSSCLDGPVEAVVLGAMVVLTCLAGPSTPGDRPSWPGRSSGRCSSTTRAATRATTAPTREVRHAPPLCPGQRPHAGTLVAKQGANAAFLSYLRLSVYMAVMSVAITLSFHLKHTPTEVERAMAFPLGTVFWVLSALVLLAGVANYISKPAPTRAPFCSSSSVWKVCVADAGRAVTVNKYSQKVAIVQTGWRTQLVCLTQMLALVVAATDGPTDIGNCCCFYCGHEHNAAGHHSDETQCKGIMVSAKFNATMLC